MSPIPCFNPRNAQPRTNPSPTGLAPWLPTFVAALGLIAIHHAAAEETLKLHNGQTVRGEILEYDERGVKIRLDSGRSAFFPAPDIDAVQAEYSPSHKAAIDAFARRDYQAALTNFQMAQKSEERPWARHQIQAGLIQTYRSMGRLDDAGRLFLDIYENRDDPEVLRLAPLVWLDDEPVKPEVATLARVWMTDERPVARLLAASWLLSGTDQKQAAEILDQLQTIDQRMGWMARAQLWRIRSKPELDDIQRFRTTISRMPLTVRDGPQFVFAQAFDRIGRSEDAALSYLWIPYVYAPGSDLAAEALLRAAAASRKCGFHDDAHKIYREVLESYPGTAWAARAEKELARDAPSDQSAKQD